MKYLLISVELTWFITRFCREVASTEHAKCNTVALSPTQIIIIIFIIINFKLNLDSYIIEEVTAV